MAEGRALSKLSSCVRSAASRQRKEASGGQVFDRRPGLRVRCRFQRAFPPCSRQCCTIARPRGCCEEREQRRVEPRTVAEVARRARIAALNMVMDLKRCQKG